MMHRLQFEEAQQSSYASTPARAGSEVKDDAESESLATEFQSLLAQLTGQMVALPDQLTAIGFALAQSVTPTRIQQREDSNASQGDEAPQDGGHEFARDAQSGSDGAISDSVDNRSGARQEQQGVVQETSEEQAIEQFEKAAVPVSELSLVVKDTGPIIESAIPAELAHETLQFSEVTDVQDPALLREITSQTGHNAEVLQDAPINIAHSQSSSVRVAEAHAHTVTFAVKKVSEKDSQDEVVTEDPFAQGLPADGQTGANQADIRRNPLLSTQKERSTEQITHNDTPQSGPAQARPQEQLESGQYGAERLVGRAEDSVPGQGPRGLDGGKKGLVRGAEQQDVAGLETAPSGEARPEQRRPDNTIQLILLRQAFEGLKAARNDATDSTRAKPQTPSIQSTGAVTESKSASLGESASRSKPLTRPQVTRMLERVESTLKEAARGRNGKTISLHLEPVDLGKVKVDVSLREGVLHARISPENQQVVHALREHAHELQGALRKLGLEVDSVTVSVTAEEFSGEMATGQETLDGRSFQQERNNMPHERAQVPDNTIGNELALRSTASVESGRSGARNVTDHWIA
jgi:flagellar hook-length control protein FliK